MSVLSTDCSPVSLRSKRFRVISEQRTRNESQKLRGSRSLFGAAKTGNPVPRSLFAAKTNGNACYAGYTPVFTSSYFFISVKQFNSFPYFFFLFIVFLFAWIHVSYTIRIVSVSLKNTESYLVTPQVAQARNMSIGEHRLYR